MSVKILIAGETESHSLEMTYCRAFRALGHEVALFDTRKAVLRHARFGSIGHRLHRFFPVEAWLRKANKEMVDYTRSCRPDIFLMFTGAEILPGALGYIRSILPRCKIVMYWADPLTNLTRYFYEGLRMADLLASYSNALLPVFTRMGAPQTSWIPFAGDPDLHFTQTSDAREFKYDIGFVGSWRPEREHALRIVYEAFPSLRYRVNGPYWNRCSYAPLKKIAQNKPLYGKDFTEVVQETLLNLNVMDSGNYPAANMRFFEIPVAGGAQLCSWSPEMRDIFTNGEEVLYYSNDGELKERVQFALDHPDIIQQIRKKAQGLLLNAHTYRHRATELLKALDQ